MFVASDAAEDDIILLTTLERINTSYFNLLVQIFLERTVELHIVDDIRPLALIRGDNANLVGPDTRLEEFGYDLLYV
jgi:hypothetical protein